MTGREQPWTTPRYVLEEDEVTYYFEFPSLTIKCKISWVVGSRGDRDFNIRIGTIDPISGEPVAHVHWSNFNIAVAATRESLARKLDTRWSDTLDWSRAIEYISTKTHDLLTDAAEDVVILNDIESQEDRPYTLFEGFLASEQPNLIYAKGGSYKSIVALIVAMAARSQRVIGPFVPIVDPGPVAIFDYETIQQEQYQRMRQILAGLEWPDEPPQLHYIRPRMPLIKRIKAYRQLIQKIGAKLVIIDSVAPALGGSVNDDDIVNAFFDALMTIPGVTFLIVAHVRKTDRDGKSNDATPIGSVFFENRSREMWHIVNSTPENAKEGTVNKLVMTCKKANNGATGRKIALTAQWDAARAKLMIGTADIRRDPDLVEHRSSSSRIRDALKAHGAMAYEEIAEKSGLSLLATKSAMHRMGDEIVVLENGQQAGRGFVKKFGLAAFREPVPIRQGFIPLDDAGASGD